MRHCSRARAATRVLAAAAVVYASASLAYLAVVRLAGVGTPFMDSLTPEQRTILSRSKRTRGAIFLASLLACGLAALAIARVLPPQKLP